MGWQKPKDKVDPINWPSVYLDLFETTVIALLERGVDPQNITIWSINPSLDFNLDIALIAGIIKYTKGEERLEVLKKLG